MIPRTLAHLARALRTLPKASPSPTVFGLSVSEPELVSDPLQEALRHEAAVVAVNFSADGVALLSSRRLTMTVRIWDANTGHPVGKPLRHEDWVYCSRLQPRRRAHCHRMG